MTETAMIEEYKSEILSAGGIMPPIHDRYPAMVISKLHQVWVMLVPGRA